MNHLLSVLALFILLGNAQAQTVPAVDLKGTKVNLDARASSDVENDVMRATLFVEMEDTDPGRLADKVNRAANDALKLAKGFGGLRARTAGYTTYPVTEKSRIVRWRSRSELSIEGEDFKRMTEAIGKLQALMQLGGVEFSVSPAARAKAEESLTQTAIADFLRKSELVTRGFKGNGFNVLEAAVSADSGYSPPPRPMVMMKAMPDSSAPAPAMEAGTSRITVSVNGQILIPR